MEQVLTRDHALSNHLAEGAVIDVVAVALRRPVGMGIVVDYRIIALAVRVSHGLDNPVRNRVITADDDRDDAGLGDLSGDPTQLLLASIRGPGVDNQPR